MTSATWLAVFRSNAALATQVASDDVGALPARLRASLSRSLGRFLLGEGGEGRIITEAAASRDPAFDTAAVEAIALYIGEEWRHAREVASVLAALRARAPQRTWSEVAFRRGRRLLGLRLKMLTIGAAEVTGIAYYSVLAERLPAPSVRAMTSVIAREERDHLRFERDFFAAAIGSYPRVHPIVDGAVAAIQFAGIASAGALIVAVEHGSLLGQLGESRRAFLIRCARIVREVAGERPPARANRPVGPTWQPVATGVDHPACENSDFGCLPVEEAHAVLPPLLERTTARRTPPASPRPANGTRSCAPGD